MDIAPTRHCNLISPRGAQLGASANCAVLRNPQSNCACCSNSCRLDDMRTNVAPFLWFVAAFMFAAVWKGQGKGVYLALSAVFAILAVRSYIAAKKARAVGF